MRILAPLITTAALAALATSAAACRAGAGRGAGGDGAEREAQRAATDGAAESTSAGPADAAEGADVDGAAIAVPGRPEVEAARNDFAAAVGIEPADVRVVGVISVTWPDSSLGCPSPGEMYTQALVPGYEVRLAGDDRTAVYHTNRGLSGAIALRRCGDDALVAPGDGPSILDAVRRDLAGRVPAGTEPALESNGPAAGASLTCPGTPGAPAADGASTLQMAVSEIVFRVGADRHVYRAWNGRFVYCGIAPLAEPVGPGTPTVATSM